MTTRKLAWIQQYLDETKTSLQEAHDNTLPENNNPLKPFNPNHHNAIIKLTNAIEALSEIVENHINNHPR